jgi:hypothetical protein
MKHATLPENELKTPENSGIAVQSAVNLSKERDSKWGGVVSFPSEKDERNATRRVNGQAPKHCIEARSSVRFGR